MRLHELGRNKRQNYLPIGQPKSPGLNLNALALLITPLKLWPDNRFKIGRKEPGTRSQLRYLTYPVVGKMKAQKIMRYLFALALMLGVLVSSGLSSLSTVQAKDDDR